MNRSSLMKSRGSRINSRRRTLAPPGCNVAPPGPRIGFGSLGSQAAAAVGPPGPWPRRPCRGWPRRSPRSRRRWRGPAPPELVSSTNSLRSHVAAFCGSRCECQRVTPAARYALWIARPYVAALWCPLGPVRPSRRPDALRRRALRLAVRPPHIPPLLPRPLPAIGGGGPKCSVRANCATRPGPWAPGGRPARSWGSVLWRCGWWAPTSPDVSLRQLSNSFQDFRSRLFDSLSSAEAAPAWRTDACRAAVRPGTGGRIRRSTHLPLSTLWNSWIGGLPQEATTGCRRDYLVHCPGSRAPATGSWNGLL